MLSDEEKKAIEWLKKADWFSARLYAPKILNLIEKQSKEIEGLKEDNKKKSIVIIEYQDLYEKLEDKIKAKIEELNDGIKSDMINYDKVKDESWKLAIHRSMAQKIEIKKVLQSLLKKE